jgi:hypothetical protein
VNPIGAYRNRESIQELCKLKNDTNPCKKTRFPTEIEKPRFRMINMCSYCETESQNQQKKEKSSKVESVSAVTSSSGPQLLQMQNNHLQNIQ